jgi:hypothetical protein
VIFSLAELHPQRLTVIDWGSEAALHPEWWSRDAVHFTRDGYEARASMLHFAVQSWSLKSLQRHPCRHRGVSTPPTGPTTGATSSSGWDRTKRPSRSC